LKTVEAPFLELVKQIHVLDVSGLVQRCVGHVVFEEHAHLGVVMQKLQKTAARDSQLVVYPQ
jgi:hypothetical protein